MIATRRAALAVLLVLVAGCGRDPSPLSGVWVGRLTLVDGSRPGAAAIELDLEQTGAEIRGELRWRDPEGSLDPLPIPRLELREGLFGEGALYFTAFARHPVGQVRLDFYGDASAERIEGEIRLRVTDLAEGKDLGGELRVERRKPSRSI